MVYLNDINDMKGGEMVFPDLDLSIKPRRGKGLIWNNMDYDTDKCQSESKHFMMPIKEFTHNKLYVLHRFYYNEDFPSLDVRNKEAILPRRESKTPRVQCSFNDKSCRLYDEWQPENTFENRNSFKNFP
jgi:hypothetical protein